jgi:hypothetical protein
MPIDTSRPNRDFVWGIAAIANLLNRTPKQLYPLVAQNRIEGVKKVNGRYVGYVPKILASHGATDDDRADDTSVATIGMNGSA